VSNTLTEFAVSDHEVYPQLDRGWESVNSSVLNRDRPVHLFVVLIVRVKDPDMSIFKHLVKSCSG
jgi:hypothetical protein